MGEIATPHQRVHAGVVALADGDRVVQKPPEILFTEIVAWLPLEGFQAPLLLHQIAVPAVVVIDLKESKRQPTRLRLRPVDLQSRKPVEYTGKRQLHGCEGGI